MFGLFKKKKLPKKVLLLCAIPYDKESFLNSYKTGESDFIRSLANLYGTDSVSVIWERYAQTAALLRQTMQNASKLGAAIIEHTSIDSFNRMNEYDIIILIAHHSDNSDEIELQGHLVSTKKLIQAIPLDTNAIIDMTSCYSAFLLPKIKARIPQSTIIGIDIATSLPLRLILLDETLQLLCKKSNLSYKEALVETLRKIPSAPDSSSIKEQTKESVKLGSNKLKSTIYAPNEARKGDEFMVSVFLHKPEESEEVELMAKVLDDNATLRNSKSLNVKISKGDKIDFQLSCAAGGSSDFSFDENKKGLIWDNEMSSVEFCVSISPNCTKKAFIGKLKIAVNKTPAGEMLFKTDIIEQTNLNIKKECAELHFISYNPIEEQKNSEEELLFKLKGQESNLQERLSSLNPTDSLYAQTQLDLNVCKKCIELISESRSTPKNRMLKVFISSTSDLKPFRQVVRDQIESCEMYPDMYELWGQGNDYPRDMCCRHVLDSDIFVCLLGAKYGYVEPAWGMSMTEIEFRVALKSGKPILVYIHNQYKEEMKKLLPENTTAVELQNKLIDELREKRMVGFFSSEMSLALLSIAELSTLKHKIS